MSNVKGDNEQIRKALMSIYDRMYDHFGPRGWWPGETLFEICVGAILTQSVSWKNVTKAITNLRNVGLLNLNSMYHCSLEDLERCIIPTLYFRMKAKKLKAFVNHVIENYNGDLKSMLSQEISYLRQELLGMYGIGPETADSILLYAAEKPIFVVDAYTRRIFSRIGFWDEDITYSEMQKFFMNHLSRDFSFFNEYHALIVGVGNKFCSNKKPRCDECPVMELCDHPIIR